MNKTTEQKPKHQNNLTALLMSIHECLKRNHFLNDITNISIQKYTRPSRDEEQFCMCIVLEDDVDAWSINIDVSKPSVEEVQHSVYMRINTNSSWIDNGVECDVKLQAAIFNVLSKTHDITVTLDDVNQACDFLEGEILVCFTLKFPD